MGKERRVILDPNNPDVWAKYYQDTAEVRLSDSGCPGAGDGMGPAQVEKNRNHRLPESSSGSLTALNPIDPEEIWE